ncbi:MAG TPA: hypothetical protein VH934_03635 [Xanthobacteraceae bacterium]|jgi:hypothetical protein
MTDFSTVIAQFEAWLRARKLDPKDYSLAIFARDQRALGALQAELTASLEGQSWRPAWQSGGVEIHGIAIEARLRESAEAKPPAGTSNLPAAIFWPLAIAQVAFVGWLIFAALVWWRA